MKIFIAAVLVLLFTENTFAQYTGSRPDGHAPIGVMGDHTHGKGEFMVSYRYMFMAMEGSRLGSDSIADADVVSPDGQNFLITPTSMPMQMHMLGLMYAPTSRITLMAMLPFTSSSMDHMMRNGNEFSTSSSGLGDVSLGALVQLSKGENNRVHANFGLRFPTGSIDQKDVVPASAPDKAVLPYPMQLGSGTFDLEPGITYLQQAGDNSFGAQAKYLFRLGENAQDYTLGSKIKLSAWGARALTEFLSLSLRGEFTRLADIDGADARFASMLANRMVPTVFTDLRAATRLDLSVGANLMAPKSSALAGLRWGIEVGLPVVQDLDGPQLETDLVITTGLQFAF